MKSLWKYLFVLLILSSQVHAQSDVIGFWNGNLKMLTIDLQFQLKIENPGKSLNAYMNIPAQGVKAYQLPVFTYKKSKVHFELPGQAGMAKFDGVLKGDSIKGTVLQAGIKGDFILKRSVEQTAAVQQENKSSEPLPYSEDEVVFKSGTILFSGTLTRPKGDANAKYPAVILLTGSGPHNRDENIYGFRIFEKIADYLTRKGIAVLRYDDRGVGGSTGNKMLSTTEDFVGDALSAVEFMKKQNNIDVNKIGLLGHSEGGIIASMAAARSNIITFIVLMSSSGVDGGDLILEQQKLLLKSVNASDSIITQNLELQKKINDALRNDKDINDLKGDIRKFAEEDYNNLSANIKASIQDKEAYLNSNVQSQIAVFNNPWFRFFVKNNPYDALLKVTIPVFMTFGELDLQVPVEQNKPKMEEALTKAGNKHFKSVIFPKANHLYQEAKTGNPSEYSELPKEFIPGFLETISDWILQTTK